MLIEGRLSNCGVLWVAISTSTSTRLRVTRDCVLKARFLRKDPVTQSTKGISPPSPSFLPPDSSYSYLQL